MPAKVYMDQDADASILQNKTLVVLGFGSQGHAHALNLKDSGMNVIVGLYEGSKSIPVAREKGFEVFATDEAVRRGDVIFVALPDTKQAAVYEKDIAPNLDAGKTLLFSHGFSIHFKTVVPPKSVDVILVAPKGPGHIVRRQYLEGKGVPSLIAVYQNPSKQAKKVALAWAKGIGATRAGVIETKRGVGSFISATPAQAHPPREHERRLRAFVTRVLADADAAGFTIDDVIAALGAYRQGGA